MSPCGWQDGETGCSLTRSSQQTDLYLGFLAVVDQASHGLVGGYLVLNQFGRPVEFHCTTPVRPSRAQQILFGATLPAYLYGEQIGQTLLAKAEHAVALICTSDLESLAVKDFAAAPVALVVRSSQAVDFATPLGTTAVELCGCRCLLAADADQQRALAERLEPLGKFDLAEPFDRIRAAIAEALSSLNTSGTSYTPPSARCA